MYDYVFDSELVRLAILLGVVLSMLVYTRFGTTTGGAILPGYLALFVPEPTHIVMTLVIGILTTLLVQKVLRPRYMLWGRRLFEAEIVTALVFQGVWIAILTLLLVPQQTGFAMLYGIGFLLPGVLAHDMGRQGIRTTLIVTLLTALTVFALLTLIGGYRDLFGLGASDNVFMPGAIDAVFAYPPSWLLYAVILSVLVSILLYHRRLFSTDFLDGPLRAGGFVTAAYLALFVTRPLDLLFIVFASAVTYLIVTRFLMQQAILFGRSKVAAMFLVGMMVTWFIELVITYLHLPYFPWIGFNAITPTIVALLANDAHRQRPVRSLGGVSIATLLVFGVVRLSLLVWTGLGYSVPLGVAGM